MTAAVPASVSSPPPGRYVLRRPPLTTANQLPPEILIKGDVHNKQADKLIKALNDASSAKPKQ